jgi:hypothetical protein
MKTGLVSPSYHNTFDSEYATVTKSFGKYVPKLEWQVKCRFKQDPMMPLLTIGRINDAKNNMNKTPQENNAMTEGGENELQTNIPLDQNQQGDTREDMIDNRYSIRRSNRSDTKSDTKRKSPQN